MITWVGKDLRKIRKDNNELLKDMAEKVCVSIVYLSGIECGRYPPDSALVQNVINTYKLDSETCNQLKLSYMTDVSIDTLSKNRKDVTINIEQ